MKPKNLVINLNNQLTVPLPAIRDEEFNEITVKHVSLPPFVEYSNLAYTISPQSNSLVGQAFLVSGSLNDEISSTPFFFIIRVINQPPYLKSKIADKTITVGTPGTVDLSKAEDKEDQNIDIKVSLGGGTPLPAFIMFTGTAISVDS